MNDSADLQSVLKEQTALSAQFAQYVKGQQSINETLAETIKGFFQAQGYERGQNGWVQKAELNVVHTGTLLHGPGGMFSTAGLDQAIISTHVKARGLGQLLPAFPSNTKYDRFGFLTGISDDVGDEPVAPCDDAPTGYIKGGTLTAKWGRVSRDTNTIYIPDTLWQINSSETMDLQLMGSLLDPSGSGLYYPSDLNETNVLDMVTKAEQVIAGVNMERKLSKLLWRGDGSGANDTAQKGYVEFPGLDSQVATGQVDSELNVALPSADSTILDFGYANVGGASDIVEPLEEMEDFVWNLSEDTGVSATHIIAMRPMAWRAVTAVWPIQYNTQPDYTILAGGEGRFMFDAMATTRERDAMRRGLYLDLNGRRYNVVLDAGIVEENNQSGTGLGLNEFASSIYFLPLTINGNFPVLYWNYLDMKLGSPQTSLLPSSVPNWWTDSGRFMWSFKSEFACFKLKMETNPRIVLRTPHLAAKLQHVKYTRTHKPLRDFDPESLYYVDGGISSPIRNLAPTQYAPWLL